MDRCLVCVCVCACACAWLASADEVCTPNLPGTCCNRIGMPYHLKFEDATGLHNVSGGVLRNTCKLGTKITDGSFIEIVQMVPLSAVPFNVTRYCSHLWCVGCPTVAVGNRDVSNITAEVVVYDDVYGSPARQPWFVHRDTFFMATPGYTSDSFVNYWATHASLSLGLVLHTRRAHIGLRAWATCGRLVAVYAASTPGLPSHTRSIEGAAWARNRGDWARDNNTVYVMHLLGGAVASVPSAWTCDRARYNDSRACDCECGAWDPDCNASVAGPLSSNCSAGRVCDRAGHCVDPGWDTARCPLASFGGGDGCQCGCGGALDPDCRDSVVAGHWYPRADNCGAGYNVAKCSDDNVCVETWPNCSSRRYGDGVCDCRCQTEYGVLDPDCLVTNVSDCGWGHCNQGKCRDYPANWSCEVPAYDDAYCDCNCSALDPHCGNFVVERTKDRKEDCDGGFGCAPNCHCYPGYLNTMPRTNSCEPLCGDHLAKPGEDCDGGMWCTNCKCQAGHAPYSPPKEYCTGCDNGQLDPGEQCEGGVHCTNCACDPGFGPTNPPTLSCVALKCGNAAIDASEQCDRGLFCTDKCVCQEGHSPYSPARQYCAGCPNNVVDAGEQCDGGFGCTAFCNCSEGHTPTSPPSENCVSVSEDCGDRELDLGEECDGGAYCDGKCRCLAGHKPYRPAMAHCTGCNNGVLDSGEQCDSGQFCTANCTCPPGFRPSVPLSTTCVYRHCGNGVVDPEVEECDGGKFCFVSNCTCEPGHDPYPQLQTYCTGCGNGVLDPDLTKLLPDNALGRILAICSRGARVSDVLALTAVCSRWRTLSNRPPFPPWREARFDLRQPQHVSPSLWGPHTLVLKEGVKEDVALTLVRASRDSLRVLRGVPEDVAEEALATCPLLSTLDVGALGLCAWRGFAARVRAGLPAIDELPGENALQDGVLPPRGSPEGDMIAQALRRVSFECVPDETVRSFEQLGCLRVEEMTIVSRIGDENLAGDELFREALRLAESVGPLHTLLVEQMDASLLAAFVSVDKHRLTLRRLGWETYYGYRLDRAGFERENSAFGAALARLTGLTDLAVQDPDLNEGVLALATSLPSLSSLTIRWAEGVADTLVRCPALTSLTLTACKHSSESLRRAVVPLTRLVNLSVMDDSGRGDTSSGVRWINAFLAEMAEHAEWLPALRTLTIQDVVMRNTAALQRARPHLLICNGVLTERSVMCPADIARDDALDALEH
eukprot:m51a1_g9314 hypothetical protein (1223) ;mRNA; r:110491-116260